MIAIASQLSQLTWHADNYQGKVLLYIYIENSGNKVCTVFMRETKIMCSWSKSDTDQTI